MPRIVTSTTSPGNCSHRIIDYTRDGTPKTIRTIDVSEPLTSEEEDILDLLLARKLRASGATMATWLNRCMLGDEATNVKLYNFFGPGAVITKTNIGTSYVNVAPGLNGERVVVDFTGCTQFRFLLNANLVGLGQFGARCVRDGDNEILIENANLGAAGERELDSDWQALPAAFIGQGITLLKIQGKSTTAADDPAFRRCQLGLR